MKQEISRFSNEMFISKLVRWGTNILVIAAVIVLAVLSFVKNFDISPSMRNITTLGLISMVLNWLLWDMFYKRAYNVIINNDIQNTEYSVHKRYYFARKDWTYDDLQKAIKVYNKSFVEAWIQDVEEIIGKSREQIVNGGYKGMDHKFLIWRLKHRKYPKTGIKTPKDLLYILSVGKSTNMKISIKAAEKQHNVGRLSKIFTSAIGAALGASFVFEFIDGDCVTALIKMLINVSLICMSVVMGFQSGTSGGKIKISTAEEVCEKLEEWKHSIPTEVPYKDIVVSKELPKVEENTITLV